MESADIVMPLEISLACNLAILMALTDPQPVPTLVFLSIGKENNGPWVTMAKIQNMYGGLFSSYFSSSLLASKGLPYFLLAESNG